jgi:hypothetical protein
MSLARKPMVVINLSSGILAVDTGELAIFALNIAPDAPIERVLTKAFNHSLVLTALLGLIILSAFSAPVIEIIITTLSSSVPSPEYVGLCGVQKGSSARRSEPDGVEWLAISKRQRVERTPLNINH